MIQPRAFRAIMNIQNKYGTISSYMNYMFDKVRLIHYCFVCQSLLCSLSIGRGNNNRKSLHENLIGLCIYRFTVETTDYSPRVSIIIPGSSVRYGQIDHEIYKASMRRYELGDVLSVSDMILMKNEWVFRRYLTQGLLPAIVTLCMWYIHAASKKGSWRVAAIRIKHLRLCLIANSARERGEAAAGLKLADRSLQFPLQKCVNTWIP